MKNKSYEKWLAKPGSREIVRRIAREGYHRRAKDPSYRKYHAEKGLKIRVEDPVRAIYYRCKSRAKMLGKEFVLDLEWFRSNYSGYCALSGLPFQNGAGTNKRHPRSASIDRIDSSRGYTSDNCRVICLALNMSFGDWGSEAVETIAKAWINRLANANVAAL